jgi:hypothetical protein
MDSQLSSRTSEVYQEAAVRIGTKIFHVGDFEAWATEALRGEAGRQMLARCGLQPSPADWDGLTDANGSVSVTVLVPGNNQWLQGRARVRVRLEIELQEEPTLGSLDSLEVSLLRERIPATALNDKDPW